MSGVMPMLFCLIYKNCWILDDSIQQRKKKLMKHTNYFTKADSGFDARILERICSMQDGKVGYALMWLLGVPLPLLVIWYFIFGSN